MKATIDIDGRLSIIPETELEGYALNTWMQINNSIEDDTPFPAVNTLEVVQWVDIQEEKNDE